MHNIYLIWGNYIIKSKTKNTTLSEKNPKSNIKSRKDAKSISIRHIYMIVFFPG